MTVRAYCDYFSGKEEAVLQALLSFHALGMQDLFDLLHNLMNEYPAGFEARIIKEILNMASTVTSFQSKRLMIPVLLI